MHTHLDIYINYKQIFIICRRRLYPFTVRWWYYNIDDNYDVIHRRRVRPICLLGVSVEPKLPRAIGCLRDGVPTMVDDWCCYGGNCWQKGGVFPSGLHDLGVGFWEYLFDFEWDGFVQFEGWVSWIFIGLGLKFCVKRMWFFEIWCYCEIFEYWFVFWDPTRIWHFVSFLNK